MKRYIRTSYNAIDDPDNDSAWDLFNGGRYRVTGFISSFPGEMTDSAKPVKTDDPKKAIEAWFRINEKFPTDTAISCRPKSDALELLHYADDHPDWIISLCKKYHCHIDADYILDSVQKKIDDNCRGFYEGYLGDQIYPFCFG